MNDRFAELVRDIPATWYEVIHGRHEVSYKDMPGLEDALSRKRIDTIDITLAASAYADKYDRVPTHVIWPNGVTEPIP